MVNYRRSDLMVSEDEILRLLLENISEQLMSIIANEQAVNNNQRILNLMKVRKTPTGRQRKERSLSMTVIFCCLVAIKTNARVKERREDRKLYETVAERGFRVIKGGVVYDPRRPNRSVEE